MNLLLHPLTLVTFFPLLGVLVLLFLKPEQKTLARWVALGTALITFVISLVVLAQFDASNPDLQMVIDLSWIKVADFEISYQGVTRMLLALMAYLLKRM